MDRTEALNTLERAERLIASAGYAEAIRTLTGLLIVEESSPDHRILGSALNRIGRVYSSLGNIELALGYHLKALEQFEKREDQSGLAETFNYIGSVYSESGVTEKALHYKLRALEAAKRANDTRELSRAYNNIGEEYRAAGRLDDARDQYRMSLELDRAKGDKAYEAISLHNVALVEAASGNAAEARELFRHSRALSAAAGDLEMEIETLAVWGGFEDEEAAAGKGSVEEAAALIGEALDRVGTLGSPRLESMALKTAARHRKRRGDLAGAYAAMERRMALEEGERARTVRKRLDAALLEVESEKVRAEATKLASKTQELGRLVAAQTAEIERERVEALRLRDRMRRILEQFLLALSSAIEAKDPYTGGHVDRVANYAKAVAELLGIAPAECHGIYLGAIVHDVGKIGVHDAVLNKPGRLDPAELEEMQLHARMGRDILKRIEDLDTAVDIAFCHQERWDGKGYPRGLRGTDIPLAARIVTIADYWDAIVTDRPYRKAMSREGALALMASERGRAFDPDVYDIFMSPVHRIFALYG